MTDIDIAELVKKYRYDSDGLLAELEAMLPKPDYPEHMFGRWAKHSEYGDVLVVYDQPDGDGGVFVSCPNTSFSGGSQRTHVHVSELTFPEQTTRPEDVTPGEAWLVDANDGRSPYTRVAALKDGLGEWRTAEDETHEGRYWMDGEVTLIAPLVPATPAPEPQSEPEHPCTLSSLEDYRAAPVGTVVAASGEHPWVKLREHRWSTSRPGDPMTNEYLVDGLPKDVLRWGVGQ